MEVSGVSVQNVRCEDEPLATRGKRTMSNADIRGRFVWHELMTTDTDAAAAFYSKVVPWKTQDSGMPSYTLWMAGKTQVGGLTGLPSDGGDSSSTPPHWIVYIATPDVDATVAAAERLGGKVLKGATDIPNMGRYAVLTDPQGATFAVYTPPGAPPDGADSAGGGGPGEFTWHELATTDQGAALDFYVELFGWEKGEAHDMGGMVYQLIQVGGAEVGGIFTLQAPSSPPHWLSYVRVTDCDKATNVAKAAGGRILNGPMEVPGGSWITQIEDPQGGAFALVEAAKAAARKPAAKKSSGKAKATAKADAAQPESTSAASEGMGAESAKAAAKKAPGKAAAKKAAKKAVAKAKGGAGKKVAKKAVAKKAAKKVAKKAAKKAVGKRPAAKATAAKRGKSAAKKGGAGGKRAAAKKGKRR
jgi:predicted enzyme related to lactoylglutathione lyase